MHFIRQGLNAHRKHVVACVWTLTADVESVVVGLSQALLRTFVQECCLGPLSSLALESALNTGIADASKGTSSSPLPHITPVWTAVGKARRGNFSFAAIELRPQRKHPVDSCV